MNTDSSPRDVASARGTKLLLIAVDPYQIYAYWEAARSKLDAAMRQGGTGARAVLRFYDLGTNGGWFDVEIQPESKNWYVHLWTPGRSYYAELGFLGVERQFVRIVQSNVVHLPRAWPVVAVEERFVPVETPKPLPPAEAAPARAEAAPTGALSVSPAAPEHSAATQAIPSPLPKPVDSAELLKRKLTELYAFSAWRPRPPKIEEATPSVAQPQTETHIDLTAEAEKAFVNLPSSGPL